MLTLRGGGKGRSHGKASCAALLGPGEGARGRGAEEEEEGKEEGQGDKYLSVGYGSDSLLREQKDGRWYLSATMPPQQSQKLTAETLLAAPRSSPPVPNDDGTLGVYAVSTHTIGGETAREVRVMDLGGDSSLQLSADDKVHDVNWIPGSPEEVIYLRSEEKKGTQVFVANARDVSKQHYELVELDAPISNVRLKQLDGGTVAFVFTGLVGEDGRLFNDEVVEKKSTERVFDSYNIRVVCMPSALSTI